MKIYTMPLGQLQANCHIISFDDNTCIAIDIGGESDKVLKYLQENRLVLNAILLTHGHCDHIGGVEIVRRETNAMVYIAKEDMEMLFNSEKNLSTLLRLNTPTVQYFSYIKTDTLNICDKEIRVIRTPGHTKGSVCFLIENCLFSGDTLFRNGVGRTDFPGGSTQELLNSLKILADLEEDYPVYCGHHENTTLGFERQYNPCVRGDFK
ncbi:MAG: MBL fold metallo-hydrolase [Oscillospiraceae bacterium]|nr:MBL fold metallo-hydrolase [Oscillospiraceae bacterium]